MVVKSLNSCVVLVAPWRILCVTTRVVVTVSQSLSPTLDHGRDQDCSRVRYTYVCDGQSVGLKILRMVLIKWTKGSSGRVYPGHFLCVSFSRLSFPSPSSSLRTDPLFVPFSKVSFCVHHLLVVGRKYLTRE